MNHNHPLPLLAALALATVTQLHAGQAAVPSIAAAASEPAVSGLNGKLEANYGAINRAPGPPLWRAV
jgi:hypothetical protein